MTTAEIILIIAFAFWPTYLVVGFLYGFFKAMWKDIKNG